MPVSGVVASSLRITHVFVTVTESSGTVTALCGQCYPPSEVDFIGEPAGVQCVPCLIAASYRRGRDPAPHAGT